MQHTSVDAQFALLGEWCTATCEVMNGNQDARGEMASLGKRVMAMLRAHQSRYEAILTVIDNVETRCMAVDGPVSKTADEITDEELRTIFVLAGGQFHE